jgi:hypothetical protein
MDLTAAAAGAARLARVYCGPDGAVGGTGAIARQADRPPDPPRARCDVEAKEI